MNYLNIDPVAISLGFIDIKWYGLMYLAGFATAWLLAKHRAKKLSSIWDSKTIENLIIFSAWGVILGGFFGYRLFYEFSTIITDPIKVFNFYNGGIQGMSFHGGLLGVIIALWIFSRKYRFSFLYVLDFMTPLVPLGLGFGRIGNFINGELWGRVTSMPWGIVFPHVDNFPRHPSQLYEFILEGPLLFFILWYYSSKSRKEGSISALFLILYGFFRFIIEFFREPDNHIGFVWFNWVTKGQELSIFMICAGCILLLFIKYFRGIK